MLIVIIILFCGHCFLEVTSSSCDPFLNVSNCPTDNLEKVIYKNETCLCDVKPCLLKCCPMGYSSPARYSRNCTKIKDFSWNEYVTDLPKDYISISGFPGCTFYRVEDDEIWGVLKNGSLQLDHPEGTTMLDSGHFCLEYFDDTDDVRPLVCLLDDEPEVNEYIHEFHYIVYPIGMIISIPFLIATLLVYLMFPLLNLHGKCLVSHISALIISYLSLTIIMLHHHISDPPCIILAYIMQFAFLATFFWMNVMCFDIWWTFSSLKKPGGSVRERDMKKFLLYSVYAWGFPLLILTATLIADYTPLLPKDSRFRPDMGVNKCFFRTAPATWLYMYGPIAILIVANLIMFAFTAKKIFLHTRETQVLKSADSQRHDSKDRERFNLYLKLFIVMGVNWVAELISWADAKNKVFYITDITNTLQGFIIFVIFVCKRRVLRLLEAAVCPGRAARRNALNSSSRSRNTTASVVNGSTRGAQLPETVQLKTAAHDSDSNM